MTSIPNPANNSNSESPDPVRNGVNSAWAIILEGGEIRREVSAEDARSEEFRTTLLEEVRQCDAVTCNIAGVYHVDDADVREIFTLIAALLDSGLSLQFVDSTPASTPANLLDVTLASVNGPEDPAAFQRAVQCAIHAVAVCHPNAVEPACSQILQRIRSLRVVGYRAADIVASAREFVRQHRTTANGLAEVELADVLPDLGHAEFQIPAGWVIASDGIGDANTGELLIPGHLAITGRPRNVLTGTAYVKLAHRRNGRTSTDVVSRSAIADKRSILSLADRDIPVTSNNAADVIQYLADFEQANLAVIPESTVKHQTGWDGEEGVGGFLAGRVHMCDSSPTGRDSPQDVAFQGADVGDEQRADSVKAAGSFEEWRRLIQLLVPFPRVLFALYASFVPPLLMILRAANFVVSYAGPTSGGKTTTLSCAAATWGRPDIQGIDSYMLTWDATRVGQERFMQVLNDLPAIVDDTKLAPDSSAVVQRIYDTCAGKSKTRGSVGGLAGISAYRTVMLASGEQPLSSFSQDGGIVARVLEFWATPFGQQSAEIADLISELRVGLGQNFGHAGPAFVQRVIDSRGNWGDWRQWHLERTQVLGRTSESSSVGIRLASHAAAIDLAATLVHQTLGLPFDYQNTVDDLWPELTREAHEADRARAALVLLINHCTTSEHRFKGRTETNRGCAVIPAGGYLGVWSHTGGSSSQGPCRCVFVGEVTRLLSENGYEPISTRRVWRDRGWIACNPGKTSFKVRINDSVTDTVAVPIAVITELMGGDEDSHNPSPSQPNRRE